MMGMSALPIVKRAPCLDELQNRTLMLTGRVLRRRFQGLSPCNSGPFWECSSAKRHSQTGSMHRLERLVIAPATRSASAATRSASAGCPAWASAPATAANVGALQESFVLLRASAIERRG